MVTNIRDRAANYEAIGGRLTRSTNQALAGYPLHQRQNDESSYRQFDAGFVFGNVLNGHDEFLERPLRTFAG